jgi:hypothetical protein
MHYLVRRDVSKKRGVTIWSHEPSGMGRIVSAVEAHLEVLRIRLGDPRCSWDVWNVGAAPTAKKFGAWRVCFEEANPGDSVVLEFKVDPLGRSRESLFLQD